MGQVAGLGAGALHHVGVLAQHVVELVDQRLQLLGKAAFELPGGAAAHGGQARAQELQRPQCQLQLHGHGKRQAQRQQAQGDEQHAGKALQGFGQQGFVARHHQAQQGRVVLGQLQGACHGQQGVALGVLQWQNAVAASRVGRWRIGQAQHLVPQRARARHARLGRRAQPVNLPVQARQGLCQARVCCHGADRDVAGWDPIDGCAQMVELHHQLRLQLLGDVVLKQAAQAPAHQDNGQQHPGQRAGQQAQAQRPRSHAAWPTSTKR